MDIHIPMQIGPMATIYMPLLNEGTDAWRPVQVTPLEGAIYRVEGAMPVGEEWAFAPGTVVQCRWKKFSNGEHKLIAAGAAPTIRSAFADHSKRTAGLSLGMLPLFAAIEWLPRTPEGPPEPIPMFLIGVGWVLGSLIVMIWLKPASLTGKWALRSALGFSILSCLMTLA